MHPQQMLERLMPAEQDFAFFNALRTSGAAGIAGIQRSAAGSWLVLRDSGRPNSMYYNRGIASEAAAFAALPPGLAAIETLPAQIDEDSVEQLQRAGYAPAYTLCYLGRVPAISASPAWDVQRLGAAETEVFFDLLEAQGVPFPPERREAKRNFYCNDRLRCYVARAADGTVVAGATMFVAGDSGFLANSFTLAAWRRSGAHAALLAARLNDAVAAGLAVVYTDVEHGSQSHYNAERAGFRTLTINTLWRLTPPR